MKEEKYLVAVYGSLRKGLHNHKVLGGSELVGTFVSEPKYTMISLGGFPGLYQKGNTSVTFEVYKVNNAILSSVNGLEGYDPNGVNNTFYDRKIISTPFGDAFTYTYVRELDRESDNIVQSGNWKTYLEESQKLNFQFNE